MRGGCSTCPHMKRNTMEKLYLCMEYEQPEITLPDWVIERLSVTFRMPTITGESLTLHGAITERHEMADGVRVVCDVVIEHPDGERAVTGTATLRQAATR